jgi:hypothetical protein
MIEGSQDFYRYREPTTERKFPAVVETFGSGVTAASTEKSTAILT